MARVYITGSTDGLGRAAAQSLLNEGHEVVLHARSPERAAALSDLVPRAAGVVLVTAAAIFWIVLVAGQANPHHTNPYLGILLFVNTRAREQGMTTHLVQVPKHVLALLDLTKLTQIFAEVSAR